MHLAFKKDLIPGGGLRATPAASRKLFKVEGLSTEENTRLLVLDVKTKPRWAVCRLKLSGGTTDGFIVFGEQFVSFLREDSGEVAFSQPYHKIHAYGREVGNGFTESQRVWWVFYPPGQLIQEPIQYVFLINKTSRPGIPYGVAPDMFWLEEFDRAILESERRKWRPQNYLAHADLATGRNAAFAHLHPKDQLSAYSSLFAPDGREICPQCERGFGSTQKEQEEAVTINSVRVHAECLAASRKSTKIGVISVLGTADIPSYVLDRDRFPVVWLETKHTPGTEASPIITSLFNTMAASTSVNGVLLCPCWAGLVLLNPAEGQRFEFSATLLCISWKHVRTWSHRRVLDGARVELTAVMKDKSEAIFVFGTPRHEALIAAFVTFTDSWQSHPNNRFPDFWPPLRLI